MKDLLGRAHIVWNTLLVVAELIPLGFLIEACETQNGGTPPKPRLIHLLNLPVGIVDRLTLSWCGERRIYTSDSCGNILDWLGWYIIVFARVQVADLRHWWHRRQIMLGRIDGRPGDFCADLGGCSDRWGDCISELENHSVGFLLQNDVVNQLSQSGDILIHFGNELKFDRLNFFLSILVYGKRGM